MRSKQVTLLRWKRPEWHYQSTKCGRYYVEREEFIPRWHAHRADLHIADGPDEALTLADFETREEAKAYCEADAVKESD